MLGIGPIIGWEHSRSAASPLVSGSEDGSRKRARFRVVPFFGGDEQTGAGLGLDISF